MKWLADENFRGAIVRGLLRRSPRFDIARAQDIAEVSGGDDVTLLNWAVRHERILITHDLSTMIPALHALMQSAVHPSVVLVSDSLPVSQAVEDILLLDTCSTKSDWEAGVIYLPLR